MLESAEVDEVHSYDDMSVLSPAGRVILRCRSCGVLPVAHQDTTLSDLTNAAMEHLLEVHADTLTLALEGAGSDRDLEATATAVESDPLAMDDFWALVVLLGPKGAAGDVEALVRGLSALTEDSIMAFHQQLMTAVSALGSASHARQAFFDVDHPSRALAAAPGDVFLHARVAVVAAGPKVYRSVLADPRQLAHGWPLRAARVVLGAAPAALARVTAGRTSLPQSPRAPTSRTAVADGVNQDEPSNRDRACP